MTTALFATPADFVAAVVVRPILPLSQELPSAAAPIEEPQPAAQPPEPEQLPPAQVHAQPARATARPLHRIRQVRRLQGASLRSVAGKTKTDVRRLKAQEQETSDLRLSELYKWQRALDVPVAELLEAPTMELSPAVRDRARLVRVMKTAAAILEAADTSDTQQLAQAIVDQLIAVMPELKHVGAWHTVGQRRGPHDTCRMLEQVFAASDWE
jgi:transcriptional regulator with XRE-family HTH domain